MCGGATPASSMQWKLLNLEQRCITDISQQAVTLSNTIYASFQKEQQCCCLALLDLLPTVECIAPVEALETMAAGSGGLYYTYILAPDF